MTAEPTSTTESKPKRRRWLQFSLRTLLLVMIPIACVSAWLGSEYQRGRRQYAAIKWVEEQGGEIVYCPAESPANWRRQWFGEWFPLSPLRIDMSPPPPPSPTGRPVLFNPHYIGDIGQLAELTSLQELYLDTILFDDPAPLAALENLRVLDLSFTNVGDLRSLASLTQLEELNLWGTQVTDLSTLLPLAKLRKLQYSAPSTTAESFATTVAEVARLRQLRELHIGGVPIRDLRTLCALENLESLHIGSPSVSFDDVSALQELMLHFEVHTEPHVLVY